MSEKVNVGKSIFEMISVLSKRGNGKMETTIRGGGNRELWLWYHEACAHELTSESNAERRLSAAMVSKFACEAMRRIGMLSEDEFIAREAEIQGVFQLEPQAIPLPPRMAEG